MTYCVAALVVSYLLGSSPFGYWLVKRVKGVDVRTRGSGNIGMTNVWRSVGAGWGIAALVLDVAKGAAAVGIGRYGAGQYPELPALCGLVVLLGNVFSIFLGMKGGKGIGVSIGVFYSLLPVQSAMGTLVFGLALALTRMISVGSLLGVTTMAVAAVLMTRFGWASALACVACAMVWWTHRQNIRRIATGTENKIGGKKGRDKSIPGAEKR